LIKNEIKTHTSKMANYKLPRGFEITNEELPKTSSKKVKRFMFKVKTK
jgi:acyl-coenzyme A synthetase/AMP-(fatty) acid ligase